MNKHVARSWLRAPLFAVNQLSHEKMRPWISLPLLGHEELTAGERAKLPRYETIFRIVSRRGHSPPTLLTWQHSTKTETEPGSPGQSVANIDRYGLRKSTWRHGMATPPNEVKYQWAIRVLFYLLGVSRVRQDETTGPFDATAPIALRYLEFDRLDRYDIIVIVILISSDYTIFAPRKEKMLQFAKTHEATFSAAGNDFLSNMLDNGDDLAAHGTRSRLLSTQRLANLFISGLL
ncbi:hypothetical protein V8F20_003082 [Naviculisporaceae sp. PSN 640]